MRKIVFILAMLISSITNAQEVINLVKQMKCSNAQFIMNEFAEKFGESPVWVGKTANGTHITLLVNKDKKTWTLLEYDASIACVLGVGEGGSDPNFST